MTVEVPQIQHPRRWHGGVSLGLVLGSAVDTWSASALGCFWMGSPHSLRTWKLDTTSRASRIWQFLVRCLGVLFMGRLCASAALCQPTAAFGRISSSTLICSRSSHLETGHFSSALVSFSPFQCWVLPLEYSVSGTRALLGSTVDTCSTGGFG